MTESKRQSPVETPGARDRKAVRGGLAEGRKGASEGVLQKAWGAAGKDYGGEQIEEQGLWE